MSKIGVRLLTGLIGINIIFLLGCTTTQIVEQHALFVPATQKHSTLYFIRPTLQRTRGVADNDINIELDNKLALTLSLGEYAAVNIKPQKINVTLTNLSYITAHVMPDEVKRSKRFDFAAGETYFILTDFRQEEFRGVYFKPVILEREKALSMIKTLKPAGKIARNNADKLM